MPPQLQGKVWTNDVGRLVVAVSKKLVEWIEQPVYYASSAEFGTNLDWMRILEATSARFDVMGISLGGWRRLENFSKLITQNCHGGTEAGFLLMHEANPVLKEVVHPIDSAESYESLLAEISQSRVFYERLSRNTPHLQWRHILRGYPHFFLTLTDASAMLTQYCYSMTWGHGPLWKASHSSPLYEVSRREFETLWDLNAA